MPRIPCVEKVKDQPTENIYTNHLRWRPIINIETGTIENWEKGVKAKICYKVVDDGIYTLLDSSKNEIKTVAGYVPDILSVGDDGYGDYIIMDVDEEGHIDMWNPNKDNLEKYFSRQKYDEI